MRKISILLALPLLMGVNGSDGCSSSTTAESSSGAKKMTVKVPTDPDGKTIEQKNVGERLLLDNKPGSIKHLYVISAYSGQTIIYSTVRGKVTSSGKRLTPTSITVGTSGDFRRPGFATEFGEAVTDEVLQDDGTYGSSAEYIFWWDTKGVYHQHYVSGGQIVHVSDQPVAVKGVIINMSATND